MLEWLGPETSAVTAAGSGRREGRPDLLNSAGDGKASAEPSGDVSADRPLTSK